MKSSVKDLVNLPRLEQAMDRAGVDAVVARAGLNFTYLAGFAYPGTLARHVDLADSPALGVGAVAAQGRAAHRAERHRPRPRGARFLDREVRCLRRLRRAADRACCQVAAGDGARPVEDRDRAELRFRRRHGDTQGQVARAQDRPTSCRSWTRPARSRRRARSPGSRSAPTCSTTPSTRCFPITNAGHARARPARRADRLTAWPAARSSRTAS